MLLTEDPEVWVPKMIDEDWEPAIAELKAAGVDVPYENRPAPRAASDPKSRDATRNTLQVKVYQSGDDTTSVIGWGDRTADSLLPFTIEMKYNGPRAREAIHSARLVLERVLLRRRSHPHADWHRINTWRFIPNESYPDFQRISCMVHFASFSQVIPESVEAR